MNRPEEGPHPVDVHAVPTVRLAMGAGQAVVDVGTGCPVQFSHPAAPRRRYLLDGRDAVHGPDHRWGSGHIVTDRGAVRWQVPDQLRIDATTVSSRVTTPWQVGIEIERRGGAVLTETYRVRNEGSSPLRISSWGIQTPFADIYPGARDALEQCVNTHVHTGGAWAWVLAVPMSGRGPRLGLRVEQGQLWSYGVESRNVAVHSNFRGHLVLNVTDAARAPHAFGGQPVVTVAPGGCQSLKWTLGWYDDEESFLAADPIRLDRVCAPAGGTLLVRCPEGAELSAEDARVEQRGDSIAVSRQSHGRVVVTVRDDELSTVAGSSWQGRTEVFFHAAVEELVRARVDYVLAHQLASGRQGTRANAVVPVDSRTGLAQLDSGWVDWSDGGERMGTVLMMQRALDRGWVPSHVDEVVGGWVDFALEHLVAPDWSTRRGSQVMHPTVRLYDVPWLVLVLAERYRSSCRARLLELAHRLLTRAFEMGIGSFLAIGLGEAVTMVADELEGRGYGRAAVELREQLVASARHFAALGTDLPVHEVSYEQSMVAPLVDLMVHAHRLTGGEVFLEACAERLDWLTAFAGPQPHARLRRVPIRHWDGFWFGSRRQWGDVFPHHWAALSGQVLVRLPARLQTAATREAARDVLESTLINYDPDGSATCAFVMPATVDAEPAHTADPLVNDQDWPLAILLQLARDEDFDLTFGAAKRP